MGNLGNLFDSMVKEAMEEVGNGWPEASNNAVTPTDYALQTRINHGER